MHTLFNSLTHRGFSVTDYIKYYAYLYYLLSLEYLYLYNNCDITFLTMFILTHPARKKPTGKIDAPVSSHDLQQSVDRLFSHESVGSVV
jgi:hypothetical protein